MVPILLIVPPVALLLCGILVLCQVILEAVEWRRLQRRATFSIFCCFGCQKLYGNPDGTCPRCGRKNRPLNF